MHNKRELKRKLYNIHATENGYIVDVPKHRALVLSGGGSKGIGYAGMIDAMYERGFIHQLTHVSGASAGAITASFIAVGMNNVAISKLVRELNVVNLLDNNLFQFRFRAKGERFQNILELIYALQIKEHLKEVERNSSEKVEEVYQRLMKKISRYEDALTEQDIVITSVEDIIKLSNSYELLEKFDKAFSSLAETTQNTPPSTTLKKEVSEPMLLNEPSFVLPKPSSDMISPGSSKITFSDLAQLREVMRGEKQHLIKMLTVVATNQSQRKLEIYQENNDSRNESIAQKVQHSSAHPFLFVSALNNKGEYIADGGILDNMPVGPMLEAGIDREEILCVKIESGSTINERINKAKLTVPEEVTTFSSGLDYVATPVFGGEIFQKRAETSNCEKVFYHIGNMLFLDVDEISTVSMAPSQKQKEKAIENGYRQTNEWLDSLNKVFDNPLLAMLYLGVDRLDKSLLHETMDNELFTSAGHCKQIALIQESMVKELNRNYFFDIFDYLRQIEDVLKVKAKLNEVQINQALALCLRQVDFYSDGKLMKYVLEQSVLEINANQISWIRYILDLLMSAIEWILSGCFTPDPELSANASQDSIEKNSPPANKLTPLNILGLFQYEAPALFEEDHKENENIKLSLN